MDATASFGSSEHPWPPLSPVIQRLNPVWHPADLADQFLCPVSRWSTRAEETQNYVQLFT
jgi:hypothetical protein